MAKRFFFNVILCIALMTICKIDVCAENLPYIVTEGATYYESSSNFGTGRTGIVDVSNPYITIPCYAGINGYSYLDEYGNILAHDYDELSNDITIPPPPKGAVKLLKHFKSCLYSNGWIDSEAISIHEPENEPEKQNSQELADMIEKYEGMTVVIVDRSSSMDYFAEQATEEFRQLDIDENTTKVYVFGRYFKEIQAKDIVANNSEVRQDERPYDYLAEVVNDASKYNPKHLIILTDLGIYEGKLHYQPKLETIDILVPRWVGDEEERCKFISDSFPNVRISIRQFEN